MENNTTDYNTGEPSNVGLEGIQKKTLKLGGLVEQQLALALTTLTSGDLVHAKQAIKLSNQISNKRKALDQTCIEALEIKSQPVFVVKFIITVIKVIPELEMISELAEYLAKLTIQLSKNDNKYATTEELKHLSEFAQHLLQDTVAILTDIALKDSTLHAGGLDTSVKNQYLILSKKSVALIMKSPKHINRTLNMLRVARTLERIVDHAFYINENIVYTLKP